MDKKVVIIDGTKPEDRHFNADLTNAIAEAGFEALVIPHREVPDHVEQLNTSHAVIVSGVPLHYPTETAEELQPFLEPWLPEIEVPVLCICLGHQAMGLVFGGSMRRGEEVENGTVTTEIAEGFQDDPIFKGMGPKFDVVTLHTASISIEEAPELVRLASSLPSGDSTGCENNIIRVADRQIYGTQFHPEKSEIGRQLLRNFLEMSKDD